MPTLLLSVVNYFAQLKPGKMVLWFYLIWYLVTVYFHFDPNPKIWTNALGISVVIGIALMLSVSSGQGLLRNPWQTFRLFWMPFAVSSFSALIKEQGYTVIFSPHHHETLVALGVCALFGLLVIVLRWCSRSGLRSSS
uniref:hypothetical protein n=1 Tax=Cellvibrio fontiphilus TaxID=1815559 RepID=UPI002B4BE853|nr:hypothetical protein [Cellvibrio fontiphilus]